MHKRGFSKAGMVYALRYSRISVLVSCHTIRKSASQRAEMHYNFGLTKIILRKDVGMGLYIITYM